MLSAKATSVLCDHPPSVQYLRAQIERGEAHLSNGPGAGSDADEDDDRSDAEAERELAVEVAEVLEAEKCPRQLGGLNGVVVPVGVLKGIKILL